jgi:hypothetical protein
VDGTGDAGTVLGSGGSSGTFYMDDAYNMFYNPAYVSDAKNWAIIEKSNATGGGYYNNATTPTNGSGTTAQGGAVFGIDNFTLGVFFNRQDALQDSIYNGGASTMRPLDVLLGSEFGMMKWGLGLTYAGYRTADPNNANASVESTDLVVKAGVSIMNLDPFFQYRILGKDDSIAQDPRNKMWMAGARYHWNDWTPYAVYKTTNYNDSTNYRAYGAGFGHNSKLADKVNLNCGLSYFRQTVGAGGTTFGTTTINGAGFNGTQTLGSRSVVPVAVAIEGNATDWLTLRAGLNYNFTDQVGGYSVADDTSGAIGGTIHLQKFDFDFAAGHSTTGSELTGSSGGSTESQNFDFANGLFTAASLSYRW